MTAKEVSPQERATILTEAVITKMNELGFKLAGGNTKKPIMPQKVIGFACYIQSETHSWNMMIGAINVSNLVCTFMETLDKQAFLEMMKQMVV